MRDEVRLDKWLWQARFFKSRSQASKACQTNKIRVNGNAAVKTHYSVKTGDILTFVLHGNIKVIRVLKIGERRGPAIEAQSLYKDFSPPNQPRNLEHQSSATVGKRESGTGRPTKRQRRAIDQLMLRR